MRFKVKKFLYPCGANDERKEMNLIIDEHFADAEINRHLVLAQMDKGKPISTPIYYLCIYLNYLDEHGLEAVDVKMSDIQDFLQEIYIDGLPYAGKGKPCSYAVIQDYIEALSKLYDNLTLRGYKMDESLYTRSQMMMLAPAKTRKKAHVLGRNEHLTMVHYLTYMFSPNQNDVPKSAYVKWYSAEQINAIADALPLVYRCIFLDTVYVGHRVGGALSLTLDSVDLYNGTVTPTKSKTGKIHTSYIPAPLIEDMRQYLIEVRRNIATDSNAFFIGRNGKSVTYQAYRMALESARITVNKKYGWNIEALHTHAGRSTFAAALRTYQLDCRRNGIPTFSDVDFCNLMDWKSLDSLKHYDLINRIHEISPLIKELYSNFDSVVEKNGNLINVDVERV
ncbi:tyrosine-type recombinase/integrase [uncultured Subdoligranulum sp.]|uniref:tyrosine-type recombinase/integrase n=1 Tax=uncultured Subdoligranulum sp. TaxID=512298 RepID=UPI0026362204|nr:tyrosine-type recombinase/integrase [uncultured Subdoligranulum sp.]